jgi:hypothetical protein
VEGARIILDDQDAMSVRCGDFGRRHRSDLTEVHRKGDDERTAVSEGAVDAHPAAVKLDELADQRETEARSFELP